MRRLIECVHLSALVLCVTMACGSNDDNHDNDCNPITGLPDGGFDAGPFDAGPAAGDAGSGNDGGTQPGTRLSDDEIAAVLSTANSGEVSQGLLALPLAERAEVIAFARTMASEHTSVQERQSELERSLNIRPKESGLSRNLRQRGLTGTEHFLAVSAAEFDATYIATQVEGHADLLDALDKRLIPEAHSATFKVELVATRAAVAAHLKVARSLAKQLTRDGGAGDGGAADAAAGDGGQRDASVADAGARDAGRSDASTGP